MWDLVDKLGPWPILQFGLIALVIILSAMTYMRVLASKFPVTTPSGGHATNMTSHSGEVSVMYFQGYFKGVFDELAQLRSNQEVNRLQLREVMADEMRKTRHDLKNTMTSLNTNIENEMDRHDNQIKKEIAELHDLTRSIQEQVQEILVRLDERAARKPLR